MSRTRAGRAAQRVTECRSDGAPADDQPKGLRERHGLTGRDHRERVCVDLCRQNAPAHAGRCVERDNEMALSATIPVDPQTITVDRQTITHDPQRLRALERANEVRLARAELKRRIGGGLVSAADVILACPAEASSWPVAELLMSQRRWGSSRCRKFLAKTLINEMKPLGALTERQRQLLAAQLRSRASRDALLHA